jgi:hypothetical protein
LWKIVPQGNSTYKIKVIDEDKLYGVEANSALYANSYIAVSEGKTTVDPLVDKSTAGYENAGDEWKFVTPAVYEAFHAKKQLSLKRSVSRRRLRRMKLDLRIMGNMPVSIIILPLRWKK